VKKTWRAYVNLFEVLCGLMATVMASYFYSHGDMQKATFFAVLVVLCK